LLLIKHIKIHDANELQKKYRGNKVSDLILKVDLNALNSVTSYEEKIDHIQSVLILNKFFEALNEFNQILANHIEDIASKINGLRVTRDINNGYLNNATTSTYEILDDFDSKNNIKISD
jgi:hypothetical protein